MDTQIVILAAGKGKRMGPKEVPKVLIPLKGKPVISYLLEEVAKLKDLSPPVIVVGHKSTAIKETLGSKGYKYALQRDQMGTAHAVWAAQSQITAKNVLVLYGDMPFITAASLNKLMRLHDSQQAAISMFTAFVPGYDSKFKNFWHFGRIIRNQFQEIIKIQEFADASEEQRLIKEINPGIYLFQTEWLWDNIDKIDNKNAQEEFYLTDIVEIAIEENQTVKSLTINPREIFGINTLVQLEQAETLLE